MPLTTPRRLLQTLLGAVLFLTARGDARLASAEGAPRLPWGALRVLQLGDSHTGSDALQAALKAGLQDQYGDGGAGYGLPWLQRRGNNRIGTSGGWRRITLAGKATDVLVGLNGAAVEAARRGEQAWFEGKFDRMRLYLLRQPGGGALRVSVDGQALSDQVLASATPDVVVVDRSFAPGAPSHRLQLDTLQDGRCRVLGLSLENANGAVYSGLSLNGAQASWLLRLPEPLLETQLAREAPSLIVLAYGTNEAIGGGFDAPAYERSLKQVLDRLRRAAPLASLLLVAPPDAQFRGGRPGALEQVAAIQRAQAASLGAGFVDLRATMGGLNSILQWKAAGLAQNDLVHFTAQGYSRHAQAILGGVLLALDGAPQFPGLLAARKAPAAPQPKPSRIYHYYAPNGRETITDTPPPPGSVLIPLPL
jgi:lysophospholipase L1-like esterase